MPVVWVVEAADEFQAAVRWYVAISPRLGARFVRAVDHAVDAAAESPLRCPTVLGAIRRMGVRRFPYSLYFFVEEARIVVIACFHGKRNPASWQKRGPQ